MRRSYLVPALFLALLGCSAAQTPEDFFGETSEARSTWKEVYSSLRDLEQAPATAVVVGTARNQVIGLDLRTGESWTAPLEPSIQPRVAGTVVVVQTTPGDLVALDADDGEELWRIRARGSLLGIGDDGETTALSFAGASGQSNTLLMLDRRGSVLSELSTQQPIGEPAMVSGLSILPWAGNRLSAITKDGVELGRMTAAITVSRALVLGPSLVTGHWNQLLLIDDAFVNGRPVALALPGRPLPGQPVWLANGYEAQREAQPQLLAWPASTQTRAIAPGGHYASTYQRLVFGLDASSDELRWVTDTGEPVAGASAAQGGFIVCGAEGGVSLLHYETGAISSQRQLGTPVSACTVQAGSLQVPEESRDAPLFEQLAAALQLFDPALIPAQTWLLGELANIERPEVTKELIDIASNARTAPQLREAAAEYLARQRTGVEYMLEALSRHYDFLSDVLLPPPVGALADALAAMDEKRAAPPLAEHLNDPSNTPKDVERAARALTKLATPAEADELKTFFALYRATADQPALVRAVVHAAEALMRVGGPDARGVVERAARDPLTQPEVKQALAEIVKGDHDQALSSRSSDASGSIVIGDADAGSLSR